MIYKKHSLKVLSLTSLALGVSVLCLQPSARADGGFLECVGNSANTGYPVPQPSPSESANPAPITSPSPVASAPALTSSETANALVSASPSPSTTAGGSVYGIFVRPERNNQGLLAADIYLMTSHGQWIKQVGHADVDAPAPANESDTGSQNDELSYQSDPNSPFTFQLTISEGQATLNQAALFSGDNLSNLSLNCHGMHHGR